MTRRRGFTLAELLVYVSLVSAGILLIGGVELFAQRSLRAQQAQIEVEYQVARMGGQLRADVEGAAALVASEGALTVTDARGQRVRYSALGREVLGADGGLVQVEEAPALSACRFALARQASGRVRVEATFEFGQRIEGELQTRTRTRWALTRQAVPE